MLLREGLCFGLGRDVDQEAELEGDRGKIQRQTGRGQRAEEETQRQSKAQKERESGRDRDGEVEAGRLGTEANREAR